jgi:hypothetical protein
LPEPSQALAVVSVDGGQPESVLAAPQLVATPWGLEAPSVQIRTAEFLPVTPYDPQADRRQGGDRRRRRKYRFHDRRLGFDRRVNGVKMGVLRRTLIALRDRPGALRMLLAVVNALNVADYALTLGALEAGGREANPVMRSLFALSPRWAGIFKVVAVLAASLLVWESRRYRKALIVGLCMLVVFAGLFVYHVFGVAFLI